MSLTQKGSIKRIEQSFTFKITDIFERNYINIQKNKYLKKWKINI